MHMLTVTGPRHFQAAVGGLLPPMHTASHTHWIVLHKAANNSHTITVPKVSRLRSAPHCFGERMLAHYQANEPEQPQPQKHSFSLSISFMSLVFSFTVKASPAASIRRFQGYIYFGHLGNILSFLPFRLIIVVIVFFYTLPSVTLDLKSCPPSQDQTWRMCGQ